MLDYPNHLSTPHKNIEKVKYVFSLTPKLRNTEIEQIRKDAIHRDNLSRQMQGLPLVTQRAQNSSGSEVLCTGCMDIYSSTCIHRHRARCHMIEDKNILKSGSSLHVTRHKVAESDEFSRISSHSSTSNLIINKPQLSLMFNFIVFLYAINGRFIK